MLDSLGTYRSQVETGLERLADARVVERIWAKDYTVWSDNPEEISNRLNWLTIAKTMLGEVEAIQAFAKTVKADGYENVLLLGMGGSSLAPEVFSLIFGAETQGLHLEILDSTDPNAVSAFDAKFDLSKTLYVVATKSGGTAETLSAFKYYYNRALAALGSIEAAGQHFIAITDPQSKLETWAKDYHFRKTFLNDPNIGGRYSVLSYFGIVPAALIGLDIRRLLERAIVMMTVCSPDAEANAGALLGVIMGELAQAGRDKVTLVTSPVLANFGDWIEQLVAESTGKHGKGVLPIVGETLGNPDVYSNDRLFVYLRVGDDSAYDAKLQALEAAGHPVVWLNLRDTYDIGGQFFLWEFATAIAGYCLGIQPFDQPNVESAKIIARQMISEYQKTGELPKLEISAQADGISVIGETLGLSPVEALRDFLTHGAEGAYVSIHAYVQTTPEHSALLSALQMKIRNLTKFPVTIGYAPRFLHSTGQLHKGDAGKGLFIQITADSAHDLPIPDEIGQAASSMSFGTLLLSQALGDRQALLDEGRQVLRFHLVDSLVDLERLFMAL